MASAAEQLVANINWGSLGKAKELQQRLLFVLGALIVYRLGTFIPLPGVDPQAFAAIFREQASGGILGMFNVFAGGALERSSIFALNIMPYISASIVMQLMTVVSPTLEAWKKEGEAGRKKINQYTRYGTVLLATVQGYGLAIGLENLTGEAGRSAVLEAGLYFRATTVITLVGGTVFLMWLGEQMTSRGIGNGISLLIFAGIVAGLPPALVQLFESASNGAISTAALLGLLVMMVAVITLIVVVERAQRRLLVQYPKRQQGNRMLGGQSTHLPLKLNTAGVIPPIFASSLLLLPLTIVGFTGTDGPAWLQELQVWLSHGTVLYMSLYAGLIAFFCFFYTAIVFNPVETADNLRKYGAFLPGLRPGRQTADYIDHVLTRITVVGAVYLVFVCLLPEILVAQAGVPLYLGGTSLLIVVTVTMDTVAQVHSHLIAHQYGDLIEKSKLRGRRG